MPRGSRIAVVSDPGRGKSSLIQNQICRSAPWADVYVIHGGRTERIRLNRTYETYNGTGDAGVLGRSSKDKIPISSSEKLLLQCRLPLKAKQASLVQRSRSRHNIVHEIDAQI